MLFFSTYLIYRGMKFLRNEIPKTLPYAILFGVIGGVLLIVANNVFDPSPLINLGVYLITGIAAIIYVLRIRTKKEIRGTLCLTTEVFALMTFIAFLDFMMNVNQSFINPLFESPGLLVLALIVITALGILMTFAIRKLIR